MARVKQTRSVRFTLSKLAGTLVLIVLSALPIVAEPSKATIVGVAPRGERAFEFIGRSDQNAAEVSVYGYLTRIHGLPDELLFSDPLVRTETTAHFTFSVGATLRNRHEQGSVITTSAPATLTLYFNPVPVGSFDDPSSFARGAVIATFAAHYHTVLSVLQTDHGILTALADLIQLTADPFAFQGRQWHLGHHGLRGRAWTTGPGTRTQPSPVRAFFFLGGHVVIER